MVISKKRNKTLEPPKRGRHPLSHNSNKAKGISKIKDDHFWRNYAKPTIMNFKGYKCEQCGSPFNLDLHHTDYYNETIHTIKLLCRRCHVGMHK